MNGLGCLGLVITAVVFVYLVIAGSPGSENDEAS
jgi:hypothetical protein